MRLRSPVSIFTAAVAALAGTALSSSADEVRLLDGSLVRGKITHIRDGIMTIQMGAMVSGIAFDQAFPFKTNYEVEVEAMRTMGFDFYSAMIVFWFD